MIGCIQTCGLPNFLGLKFPQVGEVGEQHPLLLFNYKRERSHICLHHTYNWLQHILSRMQRLNWDTKSSSRTFFKSHHLVHLCFFVYNVIKALTPTTSRKILSYWIVLMLKGIVFWWKMLTFPCIILYLMYAFYLSLVTVSWKLHCLLLVISITAQNHTWIRGAQPLLVTSQHCQAVTARENVIALRCIHIATVCVSFRPLLHFTSNYKEFEYLCIPLYLCPIRYNRPLN